MRDDEPQLDAGLFRAICAGTGLPAIEQRSNFAFESAQDGARRFAGLTSGNDRPYTTVYTRLGNPTTAYLERVMLAARGAPRRGEGAGRGGDRAHDRLLVFSSGMAAISTLLLALLRQGDALLLGSVYGDTDSLARGLSKFGIDAVFCDTSDLGRWRRRSTSGPTWPPCCWNRRRTPPCASRTSVASRG